MQNFAASTRHGSSKLANAQQRALQRVPGPALFDELVVPQQPHREVRHVVDERFHSRLDVNGFADDERRVQAACGDKICRLKFPVGERAVDDLESERHPLDRFEDRRRLARRGRLFQREHDLGLDLRRDHR